MRLLVDGGWLLAWGLLKRDLVIDPTGFRHAGGGRKGLFIVLRYVFIVAASYLVIFQDSVHLVGAGPALMIAIALASNVVLSIMPTEYVFAWYIEAPKETIAGSRDRSLRARLRERASTFDDGPSTTRRSRKRRGRIAGRSS